MAKNYFNRYVWLLNTIQTHGYITLAQINEQWMESPLNEDGTPLAERTFHNHKEAIRDTFGIDIKFDKSRGYFLNDSSFDGEGSSESIYEWLLAALSVNNTIREAGDLRGRILFEKIPDGQMYLNSITTAMRVGKALEISYERQIGEKPEILEICPYCLKVCDQHWYLLALVRGRENPEIFALDRVRGTRQLHRNFKVPKGFDAGKFFDSRYGVNAGPEVTAVEDVVLRVWGVQRENFKLHPLHKSQFTVVENTESEDENEKWAIFSYRMACGPELERKLLSLNDSVEIFEPASLRRAIIGHASSIIDLYGGTSNYPEDKYEPMMSRKGWWKKILQK